MVMISCNNQSYYKVIGRLIECKLWICSNKFITMDISLIDYS